jgi:hypothetical protein
VKLRLLGHGISLEELHFPSKGYNATIWVDEPAAAASLKQFNRRVPKTPVRPIAAAFDQEVDPFQQTLRKAVAEAAAKQGAGPVWLPAGPHRNSETRAVSFRTP